MMEATYPMCQVDYSTVQGSFIVLNPRLYGFFFFYAFFPLCCYFHFAVEYHSAELLLPIRFIFCFIDLK